MIKKKAVTPSKPSSYYVGTGRRKEAVAKVKLVLDQEKILIVNGVPIEKYFPGEIAKKTYLEPFRTTNTLNRFSVQIKVFGSGKNGQLGAVVHGISRALLAVDSAKYRPILKPRGFLTRDPRTRERRKVGLGGKARRQKQSPKR